MFDEKVCKKCLCSHCDYQILDHECSKRCYRSRYQCFCSRCDYFVEKKIDDKEKE